MRISKENGGDWLDDDVELETEDTSLPMPVASHPPSEAGPAPSTPLRNPRNAHQKAKRRAKAQARVAAGEIKPAAARHAQNAEPLKFKSFETSSLPVSSTGWAGKPLAGGLGAIWRNLQALIHTQGFKLLSWDGR